MLKRVRPAIVSRKGSSYTKTEGGSWHLLPKEWNGMPDYEWHELMKKRDARDIGHTFNEVTLRIHSIAIFPAVGDWHPTIRWDCMNGFTKGDEKEFLVEIA